MIVVALSTSLSGVQMRADSCCDVNHVMEESRGGGGGGGRPSPIISSFCHLIFFECDGMQPPKRLIQPAKALSNERRSRRSIAV